LSEVNRLAGLDPDGENVENLKAEGLEAFEGKGEALPFADGEFDVVVFSFSPHHMSNWEAALGEAVRVSRHAVEILDVWFDDTVADQRVSHDYDRWKKVIDRRLGMVHLETLSAGDLIAPVVTRRDVTYDYVCRRIAWPSNIGETMTEGRLYLQKAEHDPELARAFDEIMARAGREGMSDEGCIQMTIEKRR
jgi:SAM-dependent methyltransferase